MPPTTWIDRALIAAALTTTVLAAWSALAQSSGNFSTLSTTGTATLNGDVLMCSGRPWIDVKCPNMAGGAVGRGRPDDTRPIPTTINTPATHNCPVHLPASPYKDTPQTSVNYDAQP